MDVNLDLVHQLWSEKNALLGSVLVEISDELIPIKLADLKLESEQGDPPKFYFQVCEDAIHAFLRTPDTNEKVFTHIYLKSIQTRPKTRRDETLANQKKRGKLDQKWSKLSSFLRDRDGDWLLSLLVSPSTCNSTFFAKVVGYHSFFHRWFCYNKKTASPLEVTSWKTYFQEIYHDADLGEDLYWTHQYILLICSQILDVLSNIPELHVLRLPNYIKEINKLKTQFFSHVRISGLNSFRKELKNAIMTLLINYPPEDIIDLLNLFYQELISFSRRHSLGEFYTNVELSREMVLVAYTRGDRVLDPCCGSGTFLIEILRFLAQETDMTGITSLYGFDIHPLSVVITKLNLAVAVLIWWNRNKSANPDLLQKIPILLQNITQYDFLFRNSQEKYDLIIGNPPWIVINSINSDSYKEKLKTLARTMEISTDTQNVSNLEISSLFIQKTIIHHMGQDSKMFLVVSAGILTGSQNERVRRFKNLMHIKIWAFEKDLFNVHNICFFARFGTERVQTKYRIQVKTKGISKEEKLVTIDTQNYVPAYITSDGIYYSIQEIREDFNLDNFGVGRFIPEQKRTLIVQKSAYHDMFRQGACIGPRNLLFVVCNPSIPNSKDACLIHPDPLIKSKKYAGWDYQAYEYAWVEEEYLYKVAKSTELIPFLMLRYSTAFLPLSRNHDYKEILNERKKPLTEHDITELFGQNFKAKSHYNMLHASYLENIKSGGAVADLFLNMNYNNKLLHEAQREHKKVVYNGIGSNVKAAYLQGDVFIDSSLYYYNPKSEEEAYYLVGVLNSPILTDFTNSMGSTGAGGSLRNIHKNPLKCNIFLYKGTPSQNLIAKLAKNLENYVQSFCVKEIYLHYQSVLRKKGCLEDNTISDCGKNQENPPLIHLIRQLTNEEKRFLDDQLILSTLLFKESGDFSQNLRQKAEILLNLIIKPKTLQNRLRKDPLFIKKMRILDLAIKRLWK